MRRNMKPKIGSERDFQKKKNSNDEPFVILAIFLVGHHLSLLIIDILEKYFK